MSPTVIGVATNGNSSRRELVDKVRWACPSSLVGRQGSRNQRARRRPGAVPSIALHLDLSMAWVSLALAREPYIFSFLKGLLGGGEGERWLGHSFFDTTGAC